MSHTTHDLAALWTASAAHTERALTEALPNDDDAVVNTAPLMSALSDAQALGEMVADAVARSFPVDRAMLLAAESLLRAVDATQPVLVNAQVQALAAAIDDGSEVVGVASPAFAAAQALEGMLAAAYPRFLQGVAA